MLTLFNFAQKCFLMLAFEFAYTAVNIQFLMATCKKNLQTWIRQIWMFALSHNNQIPQLNPSTSELIQWDLPKVLHTSLALAPLILGSKRIITLGLLILLHSLISFKNSSLLAPAIPTKDLFFHHQINGEEVSKPTLNLHLTCNPLASAYLRLIVCLSSLLGFDEC